ncbi:glycosyltransferase family 1 protein [Noviherbaspirillum cavernae]|uniref:Glycosyltransferase family 1 protein n=1 Tax=Noviherbaspirillum cavernae TaxID=2320862 RepID=A0A418X2P1_9BURK|nr:glycosyltransferase family 1 protein [Noviherbaspirillum cavernae]RJG06714.1 glycosyltransferase family 1 protein [Noviherbaspirillum cavernae]
MRKIALISEHASPLATLGGTDSGGQNVYVAHLARQLARSGYLIDVFTRADSKSQNQVVRWLPNVRIVHVTAGPRHFIPKEAMLPHMEQFSRSVLRYAHRQKIPYDLVHANFFMSGMVARQLQQALDIPFVITFHALGLVRRLSQGQADGFPDIRFAIEKQLMRDAARIIAECPQDRLDMEALYDAPGDKIDIVPCGFDPEEFAPLAVDARQQLGFGQEDFIVLQLGRMVPRKGVDNVIRATAILQQRYGTPAQLVIVGGNTECPDPVMTPELGRLMELAQSLGIADSVKFTGQRGRDQLRYYYSAANVFCTTPWYEPFGITPVEAMACGTPVVGTAVGGIKTTVVDGETGYLVPPNDPDALAERLAWLQRHPHMAQRLGWAGMRRAYRQYTWRNVASRISDVYEAAIEAATPYGTEARVAAAGDAGLSG